MTSNISIVWASCASSLVDNVLTMQNPFCRSLQHVCQSVSVTGQFRNSKLPASLANLRFSRQSSLQNRFLRKTPDTFVSFWHCDFACHLFSPGESLKGANFLVRTSQLPLKSPAIESCNLWHQS